MAAPLGIDWDAIRAEYIAGGIGQRKLAEKWGVTYAALRFQSKQHGWVEAKEKAHQEIIAITTQKTIDAAIKNVATAQRIRAKLLARLEREIDSLPDNIGTKRNQGVTNFEYSMNGKQVKAQRDLATEYRLRDLTAAWKDLTDGLVIAEKPEEAADDGFLAALSGTAAEDWASDEDEAEEEGADDGEEE